MMTNKELINEFPFLQPCDPWTGKFKDNVDYTILDDMPEGWRKAFGEQMCKDIKALLVETGEIEKYRVLQVKEKFGQLRWYGNIYTDALIQTLSKYENLSKHTCIKCGAEATKISVGWVSPWCDECGLEYNNPEHLKPISEYWENWDKNLRSQI